MTDVTIRKAKIKDAPELAELAGELGYPVSAAQAANRFKSILSSTDQDIFVAVIKAGPVLGWIHVFISLRIESEPFAEIGGYVVAAARRKSGIGRQLLTAAEQWAMRRAVTRIRIRSRTGRYDSHAIFQHMGYVKSKEQLVFVKDLSQKN